MTAQQLPVVILCFAESVGKEEQHVTRLQLYLLAFEDPVFQCPDGEIALHGEQLAGEERRLVAGIAVGEQAGGEVEHTYEHRDEHTGLVAFADSPVDAPDDAFGICLCGGDGVEKAAGDGHHQGGGDALA